VIRALIAFAVAAVAGAAIVSTAAAAKPEPVIADVDCGADGSLEVRVNGNGAFAAAHIIGGGIFVPVAFSNQHATFTDNEGNMFEEDEPDVAHNAPPNKDYLSCHFVVTFEDEEGTGTFTGDVVGFIPGR
jgi:hypothetical protein